MTNTSKNELQEDSNLSQESSLKDEVVFTRPTVYPAINKSNTSNATNVYAMYRRAKNGLDCEWQLVSQIPEMEDYM